MFRQIEQGIQGFSNNFTVIGATDRYRYRHTNINDCALAELPLTLPVALKRHTKDIMRLI